MKILTECFLLLESGRSKEGRSGRGRGMTKEEAILYFEEWIKRDSKMDNVDRLENIEIYKRAIKALEQEPCEDAVSRAAVDHLCFEFLKVNSDNNIAFYEHFRDLPSVTPIRKKGKWLSAEEYALKIGAEVTEDIKNSLYKFCPFCEQTVFTERNYCPNCGADMREVVEK